MYKEKLLKSYSRHLLEAIVVQLLNAYSVNVSLVITAFSYRAQLFQYFLQMIVWKVFFMKFYVFEGLNLSQIIIIDWQKTVSIRCFSSRSCLNQVKSPFSVYFKSFKTVLQEDIVLCNFLSILCLKIWKKMSNKG